MAKEPGVRPRGRRARISPEQFVEAGLRVAVRRAEIRPDDTVLDTERAEPAPALRDLLNIPFVDVLAEVGAGDSKAVSPPLLYTHWDSYEDYLGSVLEALYDPAEKLPTDQLEDSARPARDRLRQHLSTDLAQCDKQMVTYLGLFAGVNNGTIRQLLRDVYDGYDQQIVKPLTQVIADDGRQVRAQFGPGDEGVLALMRALTALTEGFATRRVVQADNEGDTALFEESALGIYLQLTEPLAPTATSEG